MLGDQEEDVAGRRPGDPHPSDHARRQLDPEPDVVPAPDLPDVVQEPSEQQDARVVDGGDCPGSERLVGAVQEPGQLGRGAEEVDVDGIRVERVPLRASSDGEPWRQEGGERIDGVEDRQPLRPPVARRQQLDERIGLLR